jgi:hypothetical protein
MSQSCFYWLYVLYAFVVYFVAVITANTMLQSCFIGSMFCMLLLYVLYAFVICFVCFCCMFCILLLYVLYTFVVCFV